ncbi:ATPase [Ruminococcaceae bacterium OttesenSCG-928-D13]|nr:ATPase [Ruminococcaceae bacterium OttesenSCG-928-D13]
MNIDDLLELMDETLEDAFTVPLTGKRMVDAEKLRDIIDDIRLNLPTEIRQAKAIVKDRADIVEGARTEAEGIIKKAEERARAIVSEQEIVKASEERAREIAQNAQQHAKELRASTAGYCENVLRQTEEQLAKSCAEVKSVRNSVRAKEKRGL